jgi:hypothetical protein
MTTTPHDAIPNTYANITDDEALPAGWSVDDATFRELQVAGFHGGPDAEPMTRPAGTAPLDELVVTGPQVITPVAATTLLAECTFTALRDPDGAIVATWDEGRWWTPSESDAFTAAIVAELKQGHR